MGNKYRSDGISNYSVRHKSYPSVEYIRPIIPSFLHTSAKTQHRCSFFVRKLYNYSDEDFVVTLFGAKLLIQTVAGPAKIFK